MTEYVHEVYGGSSAMIRNPDGTIREATPEELEKLKELYASELERAFKVCIP